MAAGLARAGEAREGLGSVASDDQPFSQLLDRPPPDIVPIKLKIETELFKSSTLDPHPPNVNILAHFFSLSPFSSRRTI